MVLAEPVERAAPAEILAAVLMVTVVPVVQRVLAASAAMVSLV